MSTIAPQLKKKRIPSSQSVFMPSPERTVTWIGGVQYAVCDRVIDEIKMLMVADRDLPIHLLVTSHGGPSGVGMSFYDTMQSVLQPNLVTIGSGDVDSSGLIIFLSGRQRYVTKHTTLLLHMAGRTCGDARVTTADMESMLKEDTLKDQFYADVVAEQSEGALTPERVLDMMRRSTVLTASEACAYGLAHDML